jgi:AcrR family transcriptional regulator
MIKKVSMERNEIIQKAFLLFRHYGIKRVTMDDIAVDLGISKRTLYAHFDHKEQLLIECIKAVTAEWESEIGRIKQTEQNPVLCLAKILRFAFSQLTNYKVSWFQDMRRSYEVNKAIESYRTILKEKHLTPLYMEAINRKYLHSSITSDTVTIFCSVLLLHMDEFVSNNAYAHLGNSFNELFNHLVLFGLKGSLSKGNEGLLDGYIAS